MKKLTMLTIVLAFLAIVSLTASSYGQLIITDHDLRVVKLDTGKNRIEVNKVEGNPHRTTAYVNITSDTKVYKDDKPFDWKKLKSGWIIRVRGGKRFDLGVNAMKIWVISTVIPKS